ncbi:MAG: (2Fe-2S)-binding protein [bacterium]|nr:(2Fe-2S)-binding protein [bacterium]
MPEIKFKLNGKKIKFDCPDNWTLLRMLRDGLRLTGTKEGCGKGECGACSVIMNGELVNSCLVLGNQVDNAEIITIEGLSENGELDRIQKAFIEHGAVQCGFCTPGMILAAKTLLISNPNPTLEDVREALSGNLCRCTGYKKIFEAILSLKES